MSAHPPRPRLVVRVGITGHRWDKLDHADEARLKLRVGEVLSAVRSIASRIGNAAGSGYRDPDPARASEPVIPELRLVTALAEGADRILVDAAPSEWRLQAIVPFPVDTYARDFTEPRSFERLSEYLARAREEAGVLVLDGDREAPNAFEPVGTAICLNSDLLIAIWNGLPGKSGGTAEVVELAARIGLPIVRIAPDGVAAPWLHRPGPEAEARAEGLEKLDAALQRLFLPPAPPADADEEERQQWHRLDLREAFFKERPRAWQRGQGYAFVLRLLSFSWKHRRLWWQQIRRAGLPLPHKAPAHYGEAIRRRWTGKWKRELGIPGECVDGILNSALPEHYGWASYLANYYAGRYRNSFFLGYLLSVVAVVFGAAGEFLTWNTAVGEFLTLGLIVYVVWMARHHRLHERWLAYRSVTEGFRSLTYTLPFARASTLDASGGWGDESWVDWLHRAVVREVGLPSAVLSAGHLAEARKLLLEDILPEQIEYHTRNAYIQSTVHQRLHRWTTYFFFLAVGIAALRVYEELGHFGDTPAAFRLEVVIAVVGVLGITIPAAAAAAHGFLSQGEFELSADRSRRTRRALERLQRRGGEVPLSSAALGELAAETAQAMQTELGAWFATYSGKRVNY